MGFLVQGDAVWLTGGGAPWRMSDSFVDTWLDRLQLDAERGDHSARTLYLDLEAAQRKAMGDLFIPRVTGLRSAPRLIVDNVPDVAAHLFTEQHGATL